jgi:hypothetical protein
MVNYHSIFITLPPGLEEVVPPDEVPLEAEEENDELA